MSPSHSCKGNFLSSHFIGSSTFLVLVLTFCKLLNVEPQKSIHEVAKSLNGSRISVKVTSFLACLFVALIVNYRIGLLLCGGC